MSAANDTSRSNAGLAMPRRVRLSRAKAWKMPPNTVKVDSATCWGNPFVVGKHGTAAECVRWYEMLAAGLINLSTGNVPEQKAARANMVIARTDLRGRNLACWCALDRPCHADVLLRIANAERKPRPRRSEAKAWTSA